MSARHSSRFCPALVLIVAAGMLTPAPARADSEPHNTRKPTSGADAQYWLRNMVWYHRFTPAEVTAATGLSKQEAATELKKFDIRSSNRPARKPGSPLLTMPYPGGRHPRIGFLDGAVRPQRESKISVFTPWNENDYVVVDVPEAIWSNLGLTYLAHTHVPTVWTKQGIEMKKLEWNRPADGTFDIKRRLPNGIEFGAKVVPTPQAVRMELWLKNGSKGKLTGMRVQNCVMLKGASGFNQQTNENKISQSPYSVCRSSEGNRWVITAWHPPNRVWANQKCPCLHSDPQFPDCEPGKTVHVRGWLSFYEGKDIQAELKRIDKINWRETLPKTGE